MAAALASRGGDRGLTPLTRVPRAGHRACAPCRWGPAREGPRLAHHHDRVRGVVRLHFRAPVVATSYHRLWDVEQRVGRDCAAVGPRGNENLTTLL